MAANKIPRGGDCFKKFRVSGLGKESFSQWNTEGRPDQRMTCTKESFKTGIFYFRKIFRWQIIKRMERDIIVKENLPFPYAHYSSVFIGFHRDLGTPLTFCECQKDAVTNHLAMCAWVTENYLEAPNLVWCINAHSDYPKTLLRNAARYFSKPHEHLISFMTFAPKLCHRCNLMPLHGYSDFSGGAGNYFASHFQPYINQQFYALGLYPSGQIGVLDKCPILIKEMDESTRREYIENLVRYAFSFPKRGIYRNQESMLHLYLRSFMPNVEILRHYRPDWLEGLELDFFVPDYNIGIEFQGKQHTEEMDHLGGEKAFRDTQRRDKKKAKLCKTKGIQLLCIHEDKDLNESVLRSVMHKIIPSVPILCPKPIELLSYSFLIKSNSISSRWTYRNQPGELNISIESEHLSFQTSGNDYSVTIKHSGSVVKSVGVQMQRTQGSASFDFLIGADDQNVDVGRVRRNIFEVFRMWATFDPNIWFTDLDKRATG